MSAKLIATIIAILSAILGTIGYLENQIIILEFFGSLTIVMLMLVPSCEGRKTKSKMSLSSVKMFLIRNYHILFSDIVRFNTRHSSDETYKTIFITDRPNNADKFNYKYLGKDCYLKTAK